MGRHKPDSTVPAHPGQAVFVPAQRARLLSTLLCIARPRESGSAALQARLQAEFIPVKYLSNVLIDNIVITTCAIHAQVHVH
jgi:hypothetical protein